MKLIDGHVHLVQTLAGFSGRGELRSAGGGNAIYPNGEMVHVIPPRLGEDSVTAESVIGLLDRYGVEKAVLLQGSYLGYQNLYTWDAIRQYPERFAGAAIVDPFLRERDSIMRHLFEHLSFRILKLEVSDRTGLMSYHHTFPLDGEIMKPVYDMMERLHCTVVFDIGRPGDSSWQIDALERVFRRYPDVSFVVCHLLGTGQGDSRLLAEILKKIALPNVWFDLAAVNFFCQPDPYPFRIAREHIHIAGEIAGTDRLIWGSDIPQAAARDDYADLISFLMEDGAFTMPEKEMIFYHNANKVYFGKERDSLSQSVFPAQMHDSVVREAHISGEIA